MLTIPPSVLSKPHCHLAKRWQCTATNSGPPLPVVFCRPVETDTAKLCIALYGSTAVIVLMQEVIGTAEKIDTENWKQHILFSLSALLSLIRISGEVIGAINGLACIGRLIALADEASIVGMGHYSVVDDPSSAPFLIFGYILSADALTDVDQVNKAA
ncbi:unnamed protein product [Penicillium viridicatum]